MESSSNDEIEQRLAVYAMREKYYLKELRKALLAFLPLLAFFIFIFALAGYELAGKTGAVIGGVGFVLVVVTYGLGYWRGIDRGKRSALETQATDSEWTA